MCVNVCVCLNPSRGSDIPGVEGTFGVPPNLALHGSERAEDRGHISGLAEANSSSYLIFRGQSPTIGVDFRFNFQMKFKRLPKGVGTGSKKA